MTDLEDNKDQIKGQKEFSASIALTLFPIVLIVLMLIPLIRFAVDLRTAVTAHQDPDIIMDQTYQDRVSAIAANTKERIATEGVPGNGLVIREIIDAHNDQTCEVLGGRTYQDWRARMIEVQNPSPGTLEITMESGMGVIVGTLLADFQSPMWNILSAKRPGDELLISGEFNRDMSGCVHMIKDTPYFLYKSKIISVQ